MTTVSIIGGGAVGLATAFEISKRPGLEIILHESNKSIRRNDNQSTRNSGVKHAGIYYPKESTPLKAELCVKGNALMDRFIKEHAVPHIDTGKIIVATNDQEREYLEDAQRQARSNGVPVEMIGEARIKELEPDVIGKYALLVPTSGVIMQADYLSKLQGALSGNASKVFIDKGSTVNDISFKEGVFEVSVDFNGHQEAYNSDYIINSAGIHAPDVARMIDPGSPYAFEPVRGESVMFRKQDGANASMNVYPAPYGYWPSGERAHIPFKDFENLFNNGVIRSTVGIHLTPLLKKGKNGVELDDMVMVGPGLTGGVDPEDLNREKGFDYFSQAVSGYFPGIKNVRLEDYQCGMFAKVKGLTDFHIEPSRKNEKFINLLGIDSPGLTSSLAIGQYVSTYIR